MSPPIHDIRAAHGQWLTHAVQPAPKTDRLDSRTYGWPFACPRSLSHDKSQVSHRNISSYSKQSWRKHLLLQNRTSLPKICTTLLCQTWLQICQTYTDNWEKVKILEC